MWVNPNWSKPPLRLEATFITLIIISYLSGQSQGQGQSFPQTPLQGQVPSFPQNQGLLSQQGQGPPAPQPQRPPFQQQGQQRPLQPPPSRFGPPAQTRINPQQTLSPQLPVGFPNGSSFVDPTLPRQPVDISSVMNLGSKFNVQGLTTFRIWEIVAGFLPTVSGHSSDYILSLQPQLIKGIPSNNLSRVLLNNAPLNPQVLKALVSQSSGMLPSQKSFLVVKLEPQLADQNVVSMILGTERPWELMTFFNPRLIQKEMEIVIRAISAFTIGRSDLKLAKVRLLPPIFLSSMLKTLLGDNDQLSLEALRSRNAGNDLTSLALMGVRCHQILGIKHDEVVPFLQIFRNQFYANRKEIKNLNFPINLRNCGLDALLLHLRTKAGDNGANVLSRLDASEIDAVGGEFFSAVPFAGLQNLPDEVRRSILIEIGQLQNFDLLHLLPVAQLRRYASTLMNDLSNQTPPQITPSSLATASEAPPSLNAQSLLKLGNLFCYVDILQGNSSKETIRQILEARSSPGQKTCCFDPVSQAEWAAALKKVFGSDPSAWKSQDLQLIGDLLVALSQDEVEKLSDGEIGRVIGPLMDASGLNFGLQMPGTVQPMTFARACVTLLPQSGDYLDSFKALMRKYVLGAVQAATFAERAQKVMEKRLNARRAKREVLGWNEYSYAAPNRFQIDQRYQQERYSSLGHAQRYRRQSPSLPPPIAQNAQGFQQGQGFPTNFQAQDPRQNSGPAMVVPPQQRLPPTMASGLAHPPQVPMSPQIQSAQPQRMQPQPVQSEQFQMQRQPVMMQGPPPAQQQQSINAPQRQPSTMAGPPMGQQQQFPQNPQFRPSSSQFPASQPSIPSGQKIPAPTPAQMNFQQQPAVNTQNFQGQGLLTPQQFQQAPTGQVPHSQNPSNTVPIAASGQSPAAGSTNPGKAETKTGEHLRSLPTVPEIKLTCLGIKAAGPAAIGLTMNDFGSLDAEELTNCIEAIGFVDWGEQQKRELLLLIKQKLNLTAQALTTLNLLELGNLVTALSTSDQAGASNGIFGLSNLGQDSDRFTPFDISATNLSVPHGLDTISILGTRIKNPETLKMIGDKFSKENGLFSPREGRSNIIFLKATVLSLGNIVCGLDNNVLKTIFDSSSTLFLETSPMIGRVEGCGPESLSTLARYAIRPTNYGPPESWSFEDVSTIGIVIAGLTPAEISTIPPLSLEGLHSRAVKVFSAPQLQSLSMDHLSNFSYEAANEVFNTGHHVNALSAEQLGALRGVLSVNTEHLNIPDDIRTRSIEGGEHAHPNGTAKNGTRPGASISTTPIRDEEGDEMLAEPEDPAATNTSTAPKTTTSTTPRPPAEGQTVTGDSTASGSTKRLDRPISFLFLVFSYTLFRC